jgi:hypothetical protein
MTPIIVARITEAHGIRVSGRAARSVCCQEIDRRNRDDPISTSARATQPGLAVIKA